MSKKLKHLSRADRIRRNIEVQLAAKRWGINYDLREFVRPRTKEIKKLAEELVHGDVFNEEAALNAYRWVVEEVDYPWREVPDYLAWLMVFADLHILFRHPARPRLNISILEHWKFPEETAHDRVGDCEDTSILLCSLMRAMGIDDVWVNVGTVYIDGADVGHAWVTWGNYILETTLDQLPAEPWQPIDCWLRYRAELKFNDEEVIHLQTRSKRSRFGRIQAVKRIKRMWAVRTTNEGKP